MSHRYKGGVVSPIPPTITPAAGLVAGGTAPGVWTEGEVFQARGASLWPRTAGESLYTTAGTFSWVAPANVTRVSVVCIGATLGWASNAYYGRGGGGLGYKNTITVVPGNSYTVVVSGSNDGTGSSFINTGTVLGGQGSGQDGGTFVGDGGGNGGRGGDGTGATGSGGGGGGAGGYSGNGGAGATQDANSGSAGSGGGGGGGAGGTSGSFGGGGGGVGIYGIGSNGAGGIYNAASDYVPGGGEGGSGGARGAFSNTGGAYPPAAYGGGLAGTGAGVSGGNYGGAVRIIYPGDARTFPNQAGPTT